MRWGVVGLVVVGLYGLYELVKWIGLLALGLGGMLVFLFMWIVLVCFRARGEMGF